MSDPPNGVRLWALEVGSEDPAGYVGIGLFGTVEEAEAAGELYEEAHQTGYNWKIRERYLFYNVDSWWEWYDW